MRLQAAEYSIWAAKGEDIDRVRAVLPKAFSEERRPRVRIAKRLDNSEIVGTVAWWLRGKRKSRRQAAFFIYIKNPWQSRGVGEVLVRGLITDAREARAYELVTGGMVEEGEAVYKFLTALGFDRRIRLTKYEDKVERRQELFSSLYERYTARHKIPEGAKLVTLDEAPLEEVRDLVLQNLGGIPSMISQRLRGEGSGGFDRNLSVVLMMDGKVKGVSLARVVKGVRIGDAMVVASDMRGGWANLLIRYASMKKTIAAGIEITRYSADEKKHPDTVKLAARLGAKIIGYKVILGINL